MDPPARSTPGKLGLLSSLYFSQGLPFGFFTQALPLLLRERGFSLGQIGLASLLTLPWALKFLWAPLVDRYALPRLGRRRSWIVPLQLAAAVVMAVLAAVAPPSIAMLMVTVLILNLIAATQDVATDGLAVDMLTPPERGLANGVQVAGYRIGMVVGGGVLLIVYSRLGDAVTFAAMAGLLVVATLPIVLARGPSAVAAAERPAPTLHFFHRPGARRLLVLIFSYKAGEAFASSMIRLFLADSGLSLEDVGWLLGTVGFVAGLCGALTGGALVNRFARRSALLVFGAIQATAVAGYAVVAAVQPSVGVLTVACAAEHFASGMATVTLFTCMMDWCSREASATDYTVQASTVVIATATAASLSGFSAQALGYVGHFCVATGLALVALVIVRWLFPMAEAAQLRGDLPVARALDVAPPRQRER